MKRRHTEPTGSIPTANTSVQGLEPLLGINDLALIYRQSESQIRRSLQQGTFQPVPWDKYPYRWRKADVEKDLNTRRDLRMRNHGRFGTHKLRTAKATTTEGNGHGHRKRAPVDRRRK